MSDNIPFEIQMEIVKKVYDVKSLIRFRSVSKQWKSFIDSSEFIKGYGAHHTQPHSRILGYKVDGKYKLIFLVDNDDDDDEEESSLSVVVSPLLSQYSDSNVVVGVCHGLLCLFRYDESYNKKTFVIWNPCIGKSFGIALRLLYSQVWNQFDFGFGVCPVNKDPTVVKISCSDNKRPWNVEVFTLSSGVWSEIPSGNLPRQSITLAKSTPVVIDRFIYWAASEDTFTTNDDGLPHYNYMVVSFDLITKEFKVVDLPDTITKEVFSRVSVSKLRGSLVVTGFIEVEGEDCCGVWVMERDSSFRKLFSIPDQCHEILGFTKNGEPVFEIRKERVATLGVYDPSSQQIKDLENLEISGKNFSFFMGSYKESLLLHDHSDLHIYSDDS